MNPQDLEVCGRDITLIPGKSIELSDEEFEALPSRVAQFLSRLEPKVKPAPKALKPKWKAEDFPDTTVDPPRPKRRGRKKATTSEDNSED